MKYKSKIAILLCTYNGSAYIRRQLDSIIRQSHNNWVLYVSDDGSTDETISIINEYKERLGNERVILFQGPRKGFAWNFLSLVDKVPEDFDYYAFSDQDDEWLDRKLEIAAEKLDIDAVLPELYCGRTKLVDEKNIDLGYSPHFKKNPCFRNALVQSIAGGNTMIFNRATRKIIIKTPVDKDIVSHDWWIYILVSGCGGRVIYDAEPTILYRQHQSNIIGANKSLVARLSRLLGVLDGRYRTWIQMNLEVLSIMDIELTDENKKILDRFVRARQSGLIQRIWLFSKIRLFRQTLFGSLAFLCAIMLNKV
ncbi:Glycosyl transferase family 2 [Kosakonia oryzendophytica]|uniref:Glycosyl transferase family 2 n=1 Tax=Kosakonia oryzendophytica TaxID=1005665 RepID=A0A1C3YVQ7_9ENTR|nr:glycosyltransferase family 2 protein [Kosakonia oryzendophytica]SCB74175.1 Glycosyl transferase family 2 [Kosakonia oryzendophytica]